MEKQICNVIATRKLCELTSDKQIVIQIGIPRKVSENEWECAFFVTNIEMHEIQFGYGIDGLQALIQAIEGTRVFLERCGKEVLWEGSEEGETGIPRYVPMFYGKMFTEYIGKLIDSEVENFALRHIPEEPK